MKTMTSAAQAIKESNWWKKIGQKQTTVISIFLAIIFLTYIFDKDSIAEVVMLAAIVGFLLAVKNNSFSLASITLFEAVIFYILICAIQKNIFHVIFFASVFIAVSLILASCVINTVKDKESDKRTVMISYGLEFIFVLAIMKLIFG